VNLNSLHGDADFRNLSEVVFVVEHGKAWDGSDRNGSVYIDDVVFVDDDQGFTAAADFQSPDFLDLVERRSFQYFADSYDPGTGLVYDKHHTANFASTAATGFGLTAMVVGAERGWVTPQVAQEYVYTVLDTLWSKPQCDPATGYGMTEIESLQTNGCYGFYYHFLDAQSGLRFPGSEISSADTALLLAGVVTAREYFVDNPSTSPVTNTLIAQRADDIYGRVDWNAFLNDDNDQFHMSWSPQGGFGHWSWNYVTDESILVSLLAIGSPDPAHRVSPDVFYAWARVPGSYGEHSLYQSFDGAMFQYFFANAWLDLYGLQDNLGVGTNWWENSVQAGKANYEYCRANDATYGDYSWGLTAGADIQAGRHDLYLGRNGADPRGNTDLADTNGAVHPYGAISMIGFSDRPEGIPIDYVTDAMRHYYQDKYAWGGWFGFRDGFTTATTKPGATSIYPLYKSAYWGIDQGPIVLMIDNYRHDSFVRNTFMRNASVRRAVGAVFGESYVREGETPDAYTVGTTGFRENASCGQVHLQFGCTNTYPHPAQAGYVQYDLPSLLAQPGRLFVQLRYSNDKDAGTPQDPITVTLVGHSPNSFTPEITELWTTFTETDPVDLGSVGSAAHTLRFETDGVDWGAADLDVFTVTTVYEPPPAPIETYEREAENVDRSTSGSAGARTNASLGEAHVGFGASGAGYVEYDLPSLITQTQALYLEVRYSKNNTSTVPIEVYLDGETTPRSVFTPIDTQGSNTFDEIAIVRLGSVGPGAHTLKLYTGGTPGGVADLDKLTITSSVVGDGPSQDDPIWEREGENPDAEYPDDSDAGATVTRTNASAGLVHARFGCQGASTYYQPRPEYVEYNLPLLNTEPRRLYLKVTYSKGHTGEKPVHVYLDGDWRASFTPVDTGDWNSFAQSEMIDLGIVSDELHTLRLYTGGTRWGVADLDKLSFYTAPSSSTLLPYAREGENPDGSYGGLVAYRSSASAFHTQAELGCTHGPDYWGAWGWFKYDLPELSTAPMNLSLQVRYSKGGTAEAPIEVYLDLDETDMQTNPWDPFLETTPVAVFTPTNTWSWNYFRDSALLDLGEVSEGSHTLWFFTTGTRWGVADIDKFTIYATP
jgi:hypothetical protein